VSNGPYTKIEDNVEALVDTTAVKLPDRPRILIVKMWAIGDILMATPLLRALHRQYPGCEITWLADKRYAAILDGNPMLHDVIAFDNRLWQKRFRYGQIVPYLKMTMDMRRDLNRRKFDLVINLTAEKWWAVWFQCAPVSVGLFPRPVPGYMGKLYTKAVRRSLDIWLHNSEHYILPAPALGIPGPYDRRMSVPERPEDEVFVRNFLAGQPGYRPDLPTVVLHPGTSQASKCWPVDYFAALVDKIGDAANVVITGGPGEETLAQSIVDLVRISSPSSLGRGAEERGGVGSAPISTAAAFDLRQTAALVKMASVVVTGDTSVLHIASAVETPFIGVYGSTRPGDNAPFFGEHTYVYNENVKCSPCGHADCPLKGEDFMKCMRTVTVDSVYRVARNYLDPLVGSR
jgi:heptosyltransferase-1